MKVDLYKRVSKSQFRKACRDHKSIREICRTLDIHLMEAHRLERVYQIDLPRNKNKLRKLDHDKIYATYLKNERSSRKTAKIIGCHQQTVSNIVRKREEKEE